MSKEVLKKVNKIKSVREILDINNDGKVDKDELLEGKNTPSTMSKIKNVSPMTYYLIKNQKVKTRKAKKQSNINLVRKSIKSYRKDRDLFNVNKFV